MVSSILVLSEINRIESDNRYLFTSSVYSDMIFLSMIKRMVCDLSTFGLVCWDLIFISI